MTRRPTAHIVDIEAVACVRNLQYRFSIVINSNYCLEVPYLLNSLFTCQLRLFCFRFYFLLLPFGE